MANSTHSTHNDLTSLGITADDLDDLVSDAASDIAASVNSEGIEGQFNYLVECGWTIQDILDKLV